MHITIGSKDSFAELSLTGGRIHKLVLEGEEVLGTFDRIDGKVGSTHLCVPNFGSEGVKEFGLPFHGPARGLDWTLVEQDEKTAYMRRVIDATEQYPSSLLVEQRFELNDGIFTQEITVTNTGKKEVPVNIGIHNYFATPTGWVGTTVHNQDITQAIKDNGFIPLLSQNSISLPGRRPILWSTSGFEHAVTWTGTVGGDFDKAYACIEPVVVYSPGFFSDAQQSFLGKRSARRATQTMQLG